jgi:acetolactate synthase-1/2/3 large subunit
MTIGELETVNRLDLPITIVVFNDSRLSLIAVRPEPEGHGGENAIRYNDTDFAAVAAGFGLAAARGSTERSLDSALSASSKRSGGLSACAQYLRGECDVATE